MMKLTALAVLALLAAGAFPGSASAQSRPTAMTCDQYKKELSLAITKTRRKDAEARAEAEVQQQAAQGQAYQQPEDKPARPPARDYAGVERHRRAGEMVCAQRKYELGIAEYSKAFGLLGVQPPAYLPQPGK